MENKKRRRLEPPEGAMVRFKPTTQGIAEGNPTLSALQFKAFKSLNLKAFLVRKFFHGI
jgi:hypothetical protein